jgi:hypothetical protein
LIIAKGVLQPGCLNGLLRPDELSSAVDFIEDNQARSIGPYLCKSVRKPSDLVEPKDSVMLGEEK